MSWRASSVMPCKSRDSGKLVSIDLDFKLDVTKETPFCLNGYTEAEIYTKSLKIDTEPFFVRPGWPMGSV